MTNPTLPLPLVSVIVPCYNGEKTIQRTIESVKAQTLNNLECIIVDDGSTDNSKQVIEDAIKDDRRFRYIYKNNGGVATARNLGVLQESRGLFISCLDKDDAMAPTFLEICVKALQEDRSLGIVYTGLWYIKPNGEQGLSPWPGQWDYDKQLQRQNQIPTCNVARREVWERLGGQRQRYAPSGAGEEDGEMWLRVGAYGWKAKKVTDEGLFIYSWMSGQVSGNPEHHITDYFLWHPWTKDSQHPFASYATPKRYSHPVRAYDQPAISIIIPVGPNHKYEVINMLDSLEAQTFRQWEAIVVDDTGGTENWLERVYPYIKYISTDGPKGAGFARNRGVEIAIAPFILFGDADDWLYPAALDKMITAWNANQAIVYTDYVGKAFAVDTSKLSPQIEVLHHFEKNDEYVMGYTPPDFDCERALRQPELPRPFIWCNITTLIPKTWHDEIGGFDEKLESWEDVDYHWRMARAGHCYYHLPEKLLVYRFSTGSRRDDGLQKHKNLVQYISRKYQKDGEIVGCRGCPGGGRAKKAAAAAPVAGAFVSSTRSRSKLADTPGDDDAFVKVKIVDGKRGAHPVTGSAAINPATGRRFDYGMRSDGDVILVHKDDVYLIDKHSGQQVLRDPRRFHPIEERIVEPPPAEYKETPPPQPIPVSTGTNPARPAIKTPIAVAPAESVVADGPEPSWVWERDLNDESLDAEPLFNPQMLPGVNVKVAEELIHRGLDTRAAILAAGVAGLVVVPGIGEKKAQKIVEYLNRD